MASLLRNLSVRTFSSSHNLASLSLRRTSPAAAAAPRFATAFFPATTPTFTHRSTMATDAPKKMEWLVVVPDFAGVQEKRLDVRPWVLGLAVLQLT